MKLKLKNLNPMEKENNSVQDVQIQDLFKKHEEAKSEIQSVRSTVENIRDNHLAHISVDLATTKTNVEWLLKYHWIIATASVSAMVVGIINLMKD